MIDSENSDYIGSQSERNKYKGLIFIILFGPHLAPVVLLNMSDGVFLAVLLFLVWVPIVLNNIRFLVNLSKENKKKRLYIASTFILALGLAVNSFLGNFLTFVIAWLVIIYWSLVRIEVLIGVVK